MNLKVSLKLQGGVPPNYHIIIIIIFEVIRFACESCLTVGITCMAIGVQAAERVATAARVVQIS